ncbi:uncharacterized protein LOC130614470 [Hydractinia symbiolongicarpus]|uniref:uncharacterized protein LOC130614470 n=1 Tax=Hydractinia symbiolongicarpus TaxID=13093 RepID=UPI00254A98FE|nr:uncharacterized protein LOC130614470 [Hydractinia symbiolongicarpus]XP_057291882.1 uncharacterized protein LOC130614470 [Hydractinia symbiolongicarpus]
MAEIFKPQGFLFIIDSIPFCLHIVGGYLLYRYCINISKCQKIFLLHLAFSEIVLTGTNTALHLLFSVKYFQITLLLHFNATLPYYLIMIFLTVDRFFQIYLHLTYPLYWSSKHTKFLLGCVWMVTLAILIVSVSCHIIFDGIDSLILRIYFSYVFPILDFIFLLVAFPTYMYIIHSIKMSRKKTNSMFLVQIARNKVDNDSNNNRGGEVINKVRFADTRPKKATSDTNAPLLLPTLLITTFLIFIVIPDIMHFLLSRDIIRDDDTLIFTCAILYSVGWTTDAFIYVFLSTKPGKNVLNRFTKQ